MKQNKAFTLSETLITLAIVGVIAALTISNLISKYNKHLTEVRLKQAFSMLSQGINESINDNGPISEWDIPNPNLSINNYREAVANHITPYFKDAKYSYISREQVRHCSGGYRCPRYDVTGNEVSRGYTYNYSWENIIQFNNGMIAQIDMTGWANPEPILYVDLNGTKNPNTYGKDIFSFQINKNKLIMRNPGNFKTVETILEKDCNKTNSLYSGASCGAAIQMNGWKIPPNYPW